MSGAAGIGAVAASYFAALSQNSAVASAAKNMSGGEGGASSANAAGVGEGFDGSA